MWESADEDPREFLRSYTETYLREEIAQEGLARNIAPFSRFLDIAAATDGETVNFSNVARECGISVKTAQQYYEILEDTFLVFRLPPWRRSARKRLVAHARYFFFDTGVTNSLAHTLGRELNPAVRGRRFEQLVITQILAAIEYGRLDCQLFYWRTNTGAEVDLLICRGQRILAAIEIKSSRQLGKEPLTGLRSFRSDHPHVPTYVLGAGVRERLLGDKTTAMSWDSFIKRVLPDL
jgi:predicted AAA+ superfamily ATPase